MFFKKNVVSCLLYVADWVLSVVCYLLYVVRPTLWVEVRSTLRFADCRVLYCRLFAVRCKFFVVYCLLFVVCRLLYDVVRSSFIALGLLCAVCCLFYIVDWCAFFSSSFLLRCVVLCLLFIVRWLLCVVYCRLFVVRWLFPVVCAV